MNVFFIGIIRNSYLTLARFLLCHCYRKSIFFFSLVRSKHASQSAFRTLRKLDTETVCVGIISYFKNVDVAPARNFLYSFGTFQ